MKNISKKWLKIFVAVSLSLILSSAGFVNRLAFAGPPVGARSGGAKRAETVSFGPALGAQIGSVAQGISLGANAKMVASFQQLHQSYSTMKDPQQKAASMVVLGLFALDADDLKDRLALTDLPEDAVERLLKISDKMSTAAKKDTEVAGQLEASRQAAAKIIEEAKADPDKVIPPALRETFKVFLKWGKADGITAITDPAPAAPVVVDASVGHEDWRNWDDKKILDPANRPKVTFGDASLPIFALPSEGADIASLWVKAHEQTTDATYMVAYNFDDMDIAKSIVEASKTKKQVIVGDYSNWFPSGDPRGGSHAVRSDAMKYILANLGKNLELRIHKGFGSIGIEHNKFTLFARGKEMLLQGGSFNYTKTSQLNHWEGVAFTNDADRLAYFNNLFQWLYRHAKTFSEDLKPEDPVIDEKDPIPQDPSRELVFHGVAFPKVSASPEGGTEDLLVKAENALKQTLDILMFSPFPTPRMQSGIKTLLDDKKPVRMLADAGQVSQAGTALIPLIDKGMELRTIHGPDVVLHHQEMNDHSKQHMKFMIFDGKMIDGLVKGFDSLNISGNALNHNYENTQFWQGFAVRFSQAFFNSIWDLARPPSAQLMAKLREQYENHLAKANQTDKKDKTDKPADPKKT